VASVISAVTSGVLLALLLLRIFLAGQFHLPELLGSLAFVQTAGISIWVWQLSCVEMGLRGTPAAAGAESDRIS